MVYYNYFGGFQLKYDQVVDRFLQYWEENLKIESNMVKIVAVVKRDVIFREFVLTKSVFLNCIISTSKRDARAKFFTEYFILPLEINKRVLKFIFDLCNM